MSKANPGAMAASPTPRKNLAAIKPLKFLHAAWHISTPPQMNLSIVNSISILLLAMAGENIHRNSQIFSQRQPDNQVRCRPTPDQVAKIKYSGCPRILHSMEVLHQNNKQLEYVLSILRGEENDCHTKSARILNKVA